MNGRVENDLKIFRNIEGDIINYPQFLMEWYYYLKANHKEATTCRDYIRKANHFLESINSDITKIKPDKIKDIDVIQYFIKIQTKEVKKGTKIITQYTSDSYQRCIWSCLNNLFTFLTNENYIKYNFIEKLKIEKPKNRDLARINRNRLLLTEEDFKSIMKSVEYGAGSEKAKGYQRLFRSRDICMLNLFMVTGMRKGALAAINIEDFDLDGKTLTVVDKGNIVHRYNLSNSTMEMIYEWIHDRRLILRQSDCDAFFISKEHQRISNNGIDKIVAKYSLEALGYKISPHKLRSGFISIIQSKSHDIEFTRRVVGHSNVSTTQRYIVTDNTERQKASLIMEGLLS